jgi:hypothetical protein
VGKTVYLSNKEAEWIIHWITYESNPADDEEQQVLMKLYDKATSVIRHEQKEET